MPPESDTIPFELQNHLDQWVSSRPISHWGKADLKTPLSLEFYKSWLDQGYHSSMSYLKEHLPQKSNPQLLGAQLKSSLIFCFPYLPHPEGENFPISSLRVALYAQGSDYHFWIKKYLKELSASLEEIYPEEQFLVLTDSGPVLERDLAYRAGLGWIGKNTCLIDRNEGSLFLIGEILTSLSLEANTKIVADFCGTCKACIEICPTQAIKEPRLLDAGRCISYLTIESRGVPSIELREKIGDWFFGCDLCQTVCPWNKKVFKPLLENQQMKNPIDARQALTEELKMILISSGKQLERMFKGTPLDRAGSFGLKRNAIIVAANLKIKALQEHIANYQDHKKLGELAKWCLTELGT